MVMRTREYIEYGITGPFMNRSVPENQVPSGSFGELVGVDGRYNGCLRKFYGMKEALDIDDIAGMGAIDTYDGPSFFKYVTFHKRGTSDTYRGFVVRWDKVDDNDNEQVDLVYTTDGSSWATHEIWAQAGNGITNSLEMDCTTHEGFLYVAIDTKSPKTIYWDGAALTTVDMGPGTFSATLTALSTSTDSVDSSYFLNGKGTYQIAWRFYDSTRGIYSALSDPVAITLDHEKLTKATGTISFNSGGGDSGLMVAGDIFTIGSRTYEYIDAGSDVTIAAASAATVAAHCTALADAINGDSSAVVTARAEAASVFLEATTRGSAGNSYTLSVAETGANTDDFTMSSTTLTGGGDSTSEAETNCKAVLDFPDNTVVLAGGTTFAAFDALYDKVDIFRTIDLGDSVTSTGAIFYLEQTIDMPANSGAWDSLQATIGTVLDEALPFLTQYNPEEDVVSSPPHSGTIGRYQGLTFMAQATSIRGGVDTLHSSPEHESAEYFSTFNDYRGTTEKGRPLRYMLAGDSMFILYPNAVTHVFQSAKTKPLQFIDLHRSRGLLGKQAAHTIGNSIFMVTGAGLMLLNGSDGSMGQISSVDRLLFDDWAGDLSTLESGYDTLMNTSYFLHPGDSEVLQIFHSTQSTNLLEGMNFVHMTSGPDVVDGKDVRAYFITDTGLIVVPDTDQSGSGTAWGLDNSYTVNGSTTGTDSKTSIVDSGATFHADTIGSLLYCTDGDNAGVSREITAVPNSTTLTVTAFANNVATGDRYAVSPIPFKVRLWPLRDPDPRSMGEVFKRWVMVGASLKVRKLSGFTNNDNNKWRIGTYRNNGSSIEPGTTELVLDTNPADSAVSLNADGIDIELYIEQIAAGVSFELTNVEVTIMMTGNRDVTA